MEELQRRISAYDKNIVELNNLIKTLKTYPSIFKSQEHKIIQSKFDSMIYLVLFQIDFIVSVKYLELSIITSNEIEANYFARIVSLSSYELLVKIGTLIKGTITSKEKQHPTLFNPEEFKSIMAEYNDIRKNSLEELKKIRNNVIAHKDANGLNQTKIILGMNSKDILWTANRLYRANYRMLAIYSNIFGIH